MKPAVYTPFLGIGLAVLLVACANTPSTPVDPSLPKLLSEHPDAKVVPIGELPVQNMRYRPFDQYPEIAFRNFPLEAPEVGCVMLEVLVGKDGRVRKTAVSRAYPRSTFNASAMQDARGNRYEPQETDVITYHLYKFDLDQRSDSGLIRTLRDRGATEILLEMNFKRRYEAYVRSQNGFSRAVPSIVRMPKQCEQLYNQYAIMAPSR